MKIIKDCLYGHIKIPDLCISFMDVPEFQRLRRVRQLGVAHYIYPSATHTRFEHSIGVMYLAGKMIDQLRSFTEINERTKELIQLAGMYHDIGHFSYSHLFDKFLKEFGNLNDVDEIFNMKDHEERSVYFLNKVNNRLLLLTEDELIFVKNVILGFIPLGASESFLYEIVCNARCGLDVDKLDYINRDALHTGLPRFQSDYIILNTIIDKNGYLAFKERARRDIYDLYESRQRMYEIVYQHHSSLKLDKIYFCLLSRLGNKTFQYGEKTDDFNMETLIRNSEETRELIEKLDNRELTHDCEHCHKFLSTKKYTPSGHIRDVIFCQ